MVNFMKVWVVASANVGIGVPVKGRREYVHVGSMTASMLPKPLPNTPTPPYANTEV
ncbi:protein of unknown function [Methylotuvimicrobium alcaliphilum 20Z]|uniref:Uncharacterized protein n=1 Tax=Methylotuvimicrobium alcaliphilum (strain DSM 19304 / NCIMB 14124 / VKM B-2133 / 20Z) TaxID=1091494 RepID=G4T179_META2|nr:protein of unknown function [Methylotuvimicrobium alcaliphilum 20Z]